MHHGRAGCRAWWGAPRSQRCFQPQCWGIARINRRPGLRIPRATGSAPLRPQTRPGSHDGHTHGGLPLPDHPLLPPVRGSGGGRGDPVPGRAEGPAHGQCAPLHGGLGPEAAMLCHGVVPGRRQEQGQPDLL